MNLFVFAWNADPTYHARARAVLRAMDETFPLLDVATVGEARSAHGFATWMHHADDVTGPRRYVHRDDGALVLYDGTVVAPNTRLAFHDAAVLADHWPDLTERLEGPFVALRFDTGIDTAEIVNDAMGTHTTYVCRSGDAWWIGNSVRLLAACAGAETLDLTAAAQFVAQGTPTDHRTLVSGITKLPPAQRWTWSGATGPRQASYWSFGELVARSKRTFDRSAAAELAREMQAPLRVLAERFPPLQCPITGGRDSRMLAALTIAEGLPTEYFTYGPDKDEDVVYASRIAERLGLTYRRKERSAEALVAAWHEASLRTLRKNDGLVTLMHAQNAVDVPDRLERLPVMLYGGGGERTRSKHLRTTFLLWPSVQRAIDVVQQTRLSGLSFVREDVRGTLLEGTAATIRGLVDLGFPPVDLLDAYGLVVHDGRWVATEGRQRADHKDVFMPFLSRAYMSVAFGTPASERAVERIPYLLLGQLSADLRDMPTSSPWPARNVAGALLQAYGEKARRKFNRARARSSKVRTSPVVRTRERVDVLSTLLPTWREQFLDRTGSPLWQAVDRARFEHLTSDGTNADERKKSLTNLYRVGTVLSFEEDFAEWMQRWRGVP